jgi:hypothetical protein
VRIILLAVAACASPRVAAVPPEPVAAPPTTPAPIVVPLSGCAWSFAGEFSIGGNPFRLSVDTGSGLVAVAGSACATCAVERRYTPGAGAIDQHATQTAAYDGGDMRWTGEAIVDSVGVGRAIAPVELYAIDTQQNFFATGGCAKADGILGLAGDGDYSWLAALAKAGMPDEFALHMCTREGTLWLGGYDASTCASPPTWVKMSTFTGYHVMLRSIEIAGERVPVDAAAVVDSGGPRMFLPQPAYDAIVDALAGNATFREQIGDPATWLEHGRCETVAITRDELDAALPPLTVELDGASLAMRASESYLSVVEWAGRTSYCPALRPITTALGMGVDLGNRLMRGFVVIFDRAHRRMGFAPARDCQSLVCANG